MLRAPSAIGAVTVFEGCNDISAFCRLYSHYIALFLHIPYTETKREINKRQMGFKPIFLCFSHNCFYYITTDAYIKVN